MIRSTRALAASLKMPVGLPCESLTMTPPGTSFVSRFMLANFIASALASIIWPSERFTKTGLSGVTSSINECVGSRAGCQLS